MLHDPERFRVEAHLCGTGLVIPLEGIMVRAETKVNRGSNIKKQKQKKTAVLRNEVNEF